jgi:TPR repeat protein
VAADGEWMFSFSTMKTGGLFLVWLVATLTVFAQQSGNLNRMAVDAINDMGKVKMLAEHGNLKAQIKIADACSSSELYADALKWYAAAAEQGSIDGLFQKGRMLLFGRQSSTAGQNIIAKPLEGLRYTYIAATNHHSGAWFDMAVALKEGRGCNVDSVNAYAWFMISADGGNGGGLEQMNQLALRLTTDQIRSARSTVREMKANHWPELPAQPTRVQKPVGDIAIKLKLSGVVCSPQGNLAIINNRTLAEGESSQFLTAKKDTIVITCKRIDPDGVQVQVEGEDAERTLLTASH